MVTIMSCEELDIYRIYSNNSFLWRVAVKGMVHMNTMLVPIDVIVDWEYDKHSETSHTSLFKQKKYFLPLKK